jgi:16S rRNA (cytosine1402-N4)-methyltransferase
MTQYSHIPVLLSEVIHHLQPEPNQVFFDGTVGQGGHASAIAARILPGGRLLVTDRDPVNLSIARERLASFGKSIVFKNTSYADVAELAKKTHMRPFDGILLDLGYSSLHVDDPARGFSFQKNGPLDMRYDPKSTLNAWTIVNEWDEDSLSRILRVYGEEPKAQEITKAIVHARKNATIETTLQLAQLISTVFRGRGAIHPATKTFQALRIAVNDELGELERALPLCAETLAIGGRFAIITFHSLEDRIVKQFFKTYPSLEVITKRPIVPSRDEIKKNPRARSAKLRVAVKK